MCVSGEAGAARDGAAPLAVLQSERGPLACLPVSRGATFRRGPAFSTIGEMPGLCPGELHGAGPGCGTVCFLDLGTRLAAAEGMGERGTLDRARATDQPCDPGQTLRLNSFSKPQFGPVAFGIRRALST